MKTTICLFSLLSCFILCAQDSVPSFPLIADTDQYEFYAYSKQDFQQGIEALDYAVAQFEKCIGQKPPKIGVVYFNNAIVANEFDVDTFIDRDMEFLVWINALNLIYTQFDRIPINDLELIVGSGIEGKKLVVKSAKNKALGIQKGDIIQEINGKILTHAFDLRAALEWIEEGGEIDLFVLTKGNEQKHLQFTKPAPNESMGSNMLPFAEKSLALSHEAGHVFLMAYANQLIAKNQSTKEDSSSELDQFTHYGHPLLPDWLDEGIATLSESLELQQGRKQALSGEEVELIPFETLITMAHPHDHNVPKKVDTAYASSSSNITFKMNMGSGKRRKKKGYIDIDLFYAQSWALSKFLVEEAGPKALDTFIKGYVKEKSFEQIIRMIPELPNQIHLLEEKYIAWIEKE